MLVVETALSSSIVVATFAWTGVVNSAAATLQILRTALCQDLQNVLLRFSLVVEVLGSVVGDVFHATTVVSSTVVTTSEAGILMSFVVNVTLPSRVFV